MRIGGVRLGESEIQLKNDRWRAVRLAVLVIYVYCLIIYCRSSQGVFPKHKLRLKVFGEIAQKIKAQYPAMTTLTAGKASSQYFALSVCRHRNKLQYRVNIR